MKRFDFFVSSISLVMGVLLVSCSVGLEEGSSVDKQQNTSSSKSQSRFSIRGPSGPSDIKSLSTILQRAKCPLNENQINFLLTLKPGPEFTQKINDVLDYKQIEAVKNASGGRRGGGGGRRRR